MQTPLHDQTDERSLGELLSDLGRQLTTLMRKEMELARLETSQKVSATFKDVIWMAAGGALLYAGFLVLLATAVIVLAAWMSLWLSALLVALAVLCTGGILVLAGRNRMQKRDLKPTQTIISLKESKRWIMNRT
ncbi:MAG TPA: phage holin family protein [Desulfosarcina sp.]|nr:phage holin family protein [Desulfosarcina sp.]